MGALNPLFLLLGLAAAVPILLHLLHRRDARTYTFPALRYLVRTERDRSRRIRTSQLLLMTVRVAVVILLAAAGSRLFLSSGTSRHPPTAVALVVDNSLSSGLVVGEERTLDRLAAVGQATLDRAGDDDVFWIIRAGEPWLAATPMSAGEARQELSGIRPSDARGDLGASLERAGALLAEAVPPLREIHLLSDLQASGWPEELSLDESIPVLVLRTADSLPPNLAVTSTLVGGGLSPVVGGRVELAVEAGPAASDASEISVRVATRGRVRGVLSLLPGTSGRLELPAADEGWTSGYAETGPDALRADDRRHFVYRTYPPVSVATAGDVGIFVTEALAVLASGGRTRPSAPATARVLVSEGAALAQEPEADAALLLLPPADPDMLPALNRRLSELGIPWRLSGGTAGGGATLSGVRLPPPLQGVRVDRAYEMRPEGGATAGALATVAGSPWAVEGLDDRGRRYLLLGSSMDESSTSLPVSARMVPFVAWITSEWARRDGGAGTVGHQAGRPLPAPPDARAARLPSGRVLAVGGGRTVTETGEAGLYAFLTREPEPANPTEELAGVQPGGNGAAQDSVLSWVAVVSDPRESDLAPLSNDRLRELIPEARLAENPEEWLDMVFQVGRGPELWRVLLAAAFVLLIVEGVMARSGSREGGG